MSDAAPPSLEGWIDAINAALGTAFGLDEPGKLFLEFERDLRVGVDFPDGATSYDIYAPIGLLNSAAELPRLMAALQLNLYQRATAGGVIGLDMMSGAFIYSFSFPVERSSPEILARQIDHFVTHARRLREQLEQAAGDVNRAELNQLAADLGMVREDAVEDYEADDRIEDPSPRPDPMIRV
jgi:Tir chaperone protein (CesT) family